MNRLTLEQGIGSASQAVLQTLRWDGLCRYFKASQETTNTSAGSETDCSPTAEWESLGPLSALGMSGYIPGELGLRNTIPASTHLICPHCTFLS